MAKTGPQCSVCSSKHRSSIDLGLTHGLSFRALAIRFECGEDAVARHAKSHLSPVQRAAILAAQKPTDIDLEKLSATESEGLLHQLVVQRGRLQNYAEMAASLGDVRAATSAESVILSNLATVGKLLGTLVQHHAVTHSSVLLQPDYLRLRQVLVDTLRAFPEAARAVARALHALESDAARDITATATKRQARPATALLEHEAVLPEMPDATPTIPPPPC
jgi:hypothetical protein